MKKKIMIIFVVLTLITISFAFKVNSTSQNAKESPLYTTRIKSMLSEKIGKIIKNIGARFVGERIFVLPIRFLRDTKYDGTTWPSFTEGWCTYSPIFCKPK